MAGFDPDSPEGVSNYGDGHEPGYCDPALDPDNSTAATCALMPNGNASNDQIGPVTWIMGPGSFAKYLFDVTTINSSSYTILPGMGSNHDGAATMQPGQVVDAYVAWNNNYSSEPYIDSRVCDIFDNTMATLVPSSETVTGGSPGVYAWVGVSGGPAGVSAAAYQNRWIFEYAHIPLSGDDPITGPLDPVTGRFPGTWASQSAARCNDDAATWSTDPTAIGVAQVNAVRIRPATDPATGEPYTQAVGENVRLHFGMRLLTHFAGGPQAGEVIPAGTVFANYGGVHAQGYFQTGGGWSGRRYLPSPENAYTDGDRVTVVGNVPAIQKRTISVDGRGSGVADFGLTGTAQAGDEVIWEVVATLSAMVPDPMPVDNVVITDVLPVHTTYDPACTAEITGGTPADEVLLDTPAAGRTTLRWHLGTVTPNVDIQNRRICTTTNPLAPTNTNLVNETSIFGDGFASRPSDTHTVTLDNAGGLRLFKQVDATLDLMNDDQHYTLTVQNLSLTLSVAAVTVIDVLPYVGDGTGSLPRNPASAFSGDLVLAGAPSVTQTGGAAAGGEMQYTADPPATVDQNLNTNTSTWCTEADFGDAGCPASFADVTAIKWIGTDLLTPIGARATSGFHIGFDVTAGDAAEPFSDAANAAGDRYANRFTAFSSTFAGAGGLQLLASNRVGVVTVGQSVGDLVWEDVDGDGAYDAAIDELVPDGTPIELWYRPAAGDPIEVATTTTTGGTFHFTGLPVGDYFVRIPATAFAAGGVLEGWSITPAPASSDPDENDDASHDSREDADGNIDSTVFNLDATVTAGVAHGDEPLGEDIHGVGDANDSMSNLAIDLALVRPPAIDLEKEVCLLADNSCDPAAAIGEGGWSTDDVDGVGPDTETTVRQLGATARWRIVVTNTGRQLLTDVTVTDTVVALCARTPDDEADLASMMPGDVVTWTCDSPDLTGDITPNTAEVTGNPPGGQDPVTDIDTANVEIAPPGSLTLVKAVLDAVDIDGLGDLAEFPVTVTCVDPRGTESTHDITVAADGTPTTITDIAAGSTCSAVETDTDGGVVTVDPTDAVTIESPPTAGPVITLTNAYPGVVLTKSIIDPQPVVADDGTVTVTYELVVTNPTTLDTTYDLVDELRFGSDITIESATVTNTAGDVTVATDWDGQGATTIATAVAIAAGGEHRYEVVVSATVALSITTEAADCNLGEGETGTGLLNTAEVAYEGQTQEAEDCAPAELPEPGTLTLQKAIDDPITTDELGDAASFPVTVSCVDPQGGTETFEVELAADGTPVTIEGLAAGSACTIEETDTDGGTVEYSVTNPVEIPAGGDVADTLTNRFPGIAIAKSVIDPAPATGDDGALAVTYEITVENLASVAGTYDLVDELRFGDGVEVTSSTVTNTAGGVTVDAGWNGLDAVTVVTAAAIDARAVHTFQVTVTANVAAVSTGRAADCTLDGGESGTGLLNQATATYAGGPVAAEDCATFTLVPDPLPTPTSVGGVVETTPETTPETRPLPSTGSDTSATLKLAAALVVLGGFLVVAMSIRRRRATS
ncbi:MAG: DUF5979 domain-containing protein [Desertimonas sp.]